MSDAQDQVACEQSDIACECCPPEAVSKPAGKGKGKRAKKAPVPKPEPEAEIPVPEAEEEQQPVAKKPRVSAGKGKRAVASAKAKAAKAHADALVAKALADQPVGDVSVARVYIEENAPAQSQIMTVERVQKKRKQLDTAQTLVKYRERMLAERTPEDWASLKGAWLSDYKLYTNEPKLDHSAHHGHIILELAKAKGIEVKGLCAENVKKVDVTAPDGTVTRERKFVQDPLPDGTARDAATIVYIGNQNLFTQHAQSVWSCKPDEVWVVPE